MSDISPAVFQCTIPEMRSAIMSGGDGKQVKFVIPDSEYVESSKLDLMKGQLLKVTVEIVPQGEAGEVTRNDRKKKRVVELK